MSLCRGCRCEKVGALLATTDGHHSSMTDPYISRPRRPSGPLLVLFVSLLLSRCLADLWLSAAHPPTPRPVLSVPLCAILWPLLLLSLTACTQNTLIVGPCYGFYEDAAAASRRRVGYGAAGCNLTVTEMALDCQAGLDGCRVSRESCQACDQVSLPRAQCMKSSWLV